MKRSPGRTPFLVSDVYVQKAAYHLLVVGMVLFGLLFEKVHRCFAQSDCDFDLFLVESQFTRGWKEIINDPDIAEGFIGVFYFLFHRFSFPFANNLLQ